MLLTPFVLWPVLVPERLRRLSNERGASLVEYALLVALIAIVCIAAVTTLGARTSSTYTSIGSSLA